MNYPMAIVIAAALIAGAIFFSNQNDLGAAGSGMSTGIGVDSGDKAWAVNTHTGKMRRCGYWFDKNVLRCINEEEHTLP